tara:strand:- start:661 stop:975 length:315 start_codon:yes stop_codon:yes gene_type:complete
LALLVLSCSAFENGYCPKKCVKHKLVLENGTQDTMEYAVFEQETLHILDWIAESTTENQILPNTFLKINGSDIPGYEEGKTIVLFYWTGTNPFFGISEEVVIET